MATTHTPRGIAVGAFLVIPLEELTFTASRSGGPGGQNVNKVSSRVTLVFDVRHSRSLSARQKSRILERLPSRINRVGILRVSSQVSRSQAANRRTVIGRFAALLSTALEEEKPRRETAAPAVSRLRRLEKKKHRGRLKRERRMVDD